MRMETYKTKKEDMMQSKAMSKEVYEQVMAWMEAGVYYEETHLHSKDQYDCDNDAARVCQRLKELGRKTVFLTQHGIAAATWSFKEQAEAYGLKFVPGIETYYQDTAIKNADGIMEPDKTKAMEHLILHAQDDLGWKALCMAISDAQDAGGYSLMNDEILSRYFGPGALAHGHVLATSACVTGPISMIYRYNERAEREIEKIQRRKERVVGTPVQEDRIYDLQAQIAVLSEDLLTETDERTELQKTANARFVARENAANRLKENGKQEAYEKRMEEIRRDKERAAQAKEQLEEKKASIARLRKRIRALDRERKELESIREKSRRYDTEIRTLEDSYLSEEQMEILAEEKMRKLEKLFGEGNFFAEIQYHGMEMEARVYPKVAALARRLHVPIIATNDVHIVDNTEDELLRRQMLNSLRFDRWQALEESDKELYIKSDQEMFTTLSQLFPEDVVKEGMLHSLAMAVRCNVAFHIEEHHPKYLAEDGSQVDSYEVFIQHLKEGIARYHPEGLSEAHRARLNHEVKVMRDMGYIDYHLVVEDFMKYATEYNAIPVHRIAEAPVDRAKLRAWKKENGYEEDVGMSTGAGRGSAGGSLVCDLLDITHVDPLKYGLLFERFLNPERVSMPDIDSDISRRVRPIVIQYIKQKYGEDCVAGITTQNAQAPRGSIRLAAKCYGLEENQGNKTEDGSTKYLGLGDRIAKAVPDLPDLSFDMVLEGHTQTVMEHLQEQFADDKEADKALAILRYASILEGVFTAYGAHAAGIVITDGTPIKEIVPLRWNESLGIYTTQCDMNEVEDNGMLKFDLLGLKTIDIVNDSLWQLRSEGIPVNVYDIPLDDAQVFAEIFSEAKTNSVFQFESNGMKNMLQRFRPESFDDLIILVAMYRPGPLQYIDKVIDVKNGDREATYLTPELEPILGGTYGAIVYQEQVMEIFQKLAGYTLGGADVVRRYMGKKQIEKIGEEKAAFIHGDPKRGITGCVANGIKEEAATKLFDEMTEFARYAFNKSHAAVYAYLAYITGWLKCHYPAQFLMGAMRFAQKTNKKDPIPGLMAEAKSFGVEVLPPHINESGETFTIDNGAILFGLSAVKTVGKSSVEIIEERRENGPFRNLHDFYRRCNTRKNAVENLTWAGAFDAFGANRKAMVEAVDAFKTAEDKLRKKEVYYETARKMLPFIDRLQTGEAVRAKQQELGLQEVLREPTTKERLQRSVDNAKRAIDKLQEAFDAIRVPVGVMEELDERMKAERELLGAYVTAHPLDSYPDQIRGIPPLDSFTEGVSRIYGLISDVRIRKRKSDGKPLAFFTLEDRTGTVDVNVYTKAYAENEAMIAQGAVVVIDGYTQEDNSFGQMNEEEEEEQHYVMVARTIRPAKKKERKYYLPVSSLAAFHVEEEASFREKYEDKEEGSTLYIYDEALCELRHMQYKVNRRIEQLPSVRVL